MDAFKPGDVVAFTTHPFFQDESEIVFSGDPLQQSPLMVIADKKALKADGANKSSDKTDSKVVFLCYWFSQKSQKFEFTWLQQDVLKLIEPYDEKSVENLGPGDKVIFRTSNLEIKKKKSSFQFKVDANGNDLMHLTSLMTFVSPMLVFVEKIYTDGKAGKKERQSKLGEVTDLPARFFKVKWFNFSADKFSEAVLPISSLKRVPDEPVEKIKEIRIAIKNNAYLKTQLDGIWTFLKPITINYLNGDYLLRAENVLSGRVVNGLQLESLKEFQRCLKIAIERAPLYDLSKSATPTLYQLDLIKKAAGSKSIIRIKYSNRQNVSSVRCIKEFRVYEFGEADKKEAYISGFCLSKNDIRYFKVSEIEWVEILDI